MEDKYEEILEGLRKEYQEAKTNSDRKLIKAKVFVLKLCYKKVDGNVTLV